MNNIQQLCLDHYNLALHIAQNFIGPVTHDATSEALYILLKCAHAYKPDLGIPFAAYYATVVKRHLHYWRIRKLEKAPARTTQRYFSFSYVLDHVPDFVDKLADEEFESFLLSQIPQVLTKSENQVIQLMFQNYTQTQIAKKLNLAQTTISGLQRSAIRKLKHALLKGESHE